MSHFNQAATLYDIIGTYQIPSHIVNSILKHGEPALNKDLLYEIILQLQESDPNAVLSVMDNNATSQTFYRSEIYFNLPLCKDKDDIKDELIIMNSIAKAQDGPYCPGCKSTNTVVLHIITRSLDEPYTIYIVCSSCRRKFKNAKLVYPETKQK